MDDAFNQGRIEVLDEILAPRIISHDPAEPADIQGIEAHKERVLGYREAMPDMQVRLEDIIATDEYAITRWTVSGTNTGELAGMPPTGRSIEITGMSIDRFDANGRIVETWDQWDNLGFMQQLGMIPEAAEIAG
jgi:steroid delta-isomerase-like uncharacterized protein